MANQKEYKIIINGINESIEGIGTLQESLDKLGKKVEESGGHFKTASKSMDELAKTNQKIAEYNKEYQEALQSNKMVLQDNAKEIKNKLDLEKAELIVSEDLRETYAQKQQLLTAMGKVIKNTAGDTTELQQKYAELNQELKDFDATLGNHQRSVGNYEIATKSLKGELKELTDQIALMLANGVDKADPALGKLIDRAGELKDAMADARQEINRSASDTRKLDDAINLAQSATAAFTLYKGAMSAFGVETEGAVEAIQKLQGAMAVLQSLQQLQDSLKQNSATARLFNKTMNVLSLGINGTTKATKLFSLALKGIGIGLIIGLVATLIEHWDDLTKSLGFATDAQKKLNEAMEAGNTAYSKGKAELEVYNAKLKNFNGTKEQEKYLVDELNKKYGEAFGHYKTLGQWKDILNKKTVAYCNTLALEAQMQAKVNQLSKQYEEINEFKKDFDRIREGDLTYWEQIKDFFSPGSSISTARDKFNGARKGASELEAEIDELAKKIVENNMDNDLFMGGLEKTKKSAKSTAKEVTDITQKMLDDLVKAERKAQDDIQKLRDKEVEEEKKRQEKLKQLRKKGVDLEYDYQKELLNNQLAEAKNDEEKLEIKKKLIELDKKRQEEAAKAAAADAMGISIEELNNRLNATDEKWIGLNETQKEVLRNLQTQLETIKTAADTANKSLDGDDDGKKKKKEKGFGNQFIDESKFSGVSKVIEDAYEAYAAPIVEGLGDSIHMMLEFAIEEAENALEEAEQMHDEAVDKVSESKDRLSELNDKMKESSGAQLEAYKTQMADEILLLQEREQEERRLAKEKEKREKELEKQKKRQRKLELQQQLVQAIVSGALAVVNGLATQPFVPVGIAMGAVAAAATAIQIATITKQMSKLADGGLLQGKSHSQGGIPVGNTGIEVEGGEFVVSKRATAKYLPLLDAINAEGNGGKHVINNPKSMFADGGQLNYQRIDDNFKHLNGIDNIARSIENINFSPTVSVVDINKGQKNLVSVRELAGASN